MREYARVYPSFWIGKTGKQLRKCGLESQIVAMYVLTCPHANMIGLYYLPIPYISYDTGIPLQGACKALASLKKIGFCFYDEETEFVWVPKMAQYQIGKELKPNDKQVKGIENLYNSLTNNPFLYEFYEIYKDIFHIVGARPLQGACKGLARPYEAMQCNAMQEQGILPKG